MKNVFKLLSILLLVNGVLFTSCKKEKEVTGVSLSQQTLTMEVGDKVTLKAEVAPSDAKDKAVTWESSDEAKATVDVNGNVTAKAIGKTTITVKTKEGGFTAQCNVTVVAKGTGGGTGGGGTGGGTDGTIDDNYEIELDGGFCYVGDEGNFFPNIAVGGIPANYPTGIAPNTGSIPQTTFAVIGWNNSGKTIPTGTPVRLRYTINGTAVSFTDQDGSRKTILETEMGEDVPSDGGALFPNYILSLTPNGEFYVHPDLDHLGENTICIEVLQFGNKPYPEPLTFCAIYVLQTGTGGAVSSLKSYKEGNQVKQAPFDLRIKSLKKVK